MNLTLLSDVHLDHHAEPPVLTSGGDGILIVAGDISSYSARKLALDWLLAQTSHFGAVVFVLGNHDYYGGSIEEVDRYWRSQQQTLREVNVYLLMPYDTVAIGGTVFVGSTLWSNPIRDNPSRYLRRKRLRAMADARCVYKYDFDRSADVHEEHLAALQSTLRSTTVANAKTVVVITHHLPFPQSIHPQHVGCDSNIFFMNNDTPPPSPNVVLWVHGHTHKDLDYTIGSTRVVCRPRGYPGEKSLVTSATIELPISQ